MQPRLKNGALMQRRVVVAIEQGVFRDLDAEHLLESDGLRAKLARAPEALTPYKFICKRWTTEPERFKLDSIYQIPGLNI